MPTYEYRCEKCSQTFSVKMTISEHDREEVTCPACKDKGVTQQYGSFLANTSKKS